MQSSRAKITFLSHFVDTNLKMHQLLKIFMASRQRGELPRESQLYCVTINSQIARSHKRQKKMWKVILVWDLWCSLAFISSSICDLHKSFSCKKKDLNYVRSSKCFILFSTVALTRICSRWGGLDMLRDVFSLNMMMLAMEQLSRQKKSDSMIMRITLRAARAIHRRHKSSLQSVCKPSKEISFKFFFSKVFQQLFLFACWFFFS